MIDLGRLLLSEAHTYSRCRGCVVFALLRTFGCAQRSVDDVVGAFGHRAIAMGGGVGAGVVQRRIAGDTPVHERRRRGVTSSAAVVLVVVKPEAGDVRSKDAAGARRQA